MEGAEGREGLCSAESGLVFVLTIGSEQSKEDICAVAGSLIRGSKGLSNG